MKTPPRLLIEEWLPAAAIGVECMRERGSASALAPTTYLHVWWARRPLTAARAAVLGSLLPADFPRDVFERLLGFWGSSTDIMTAQQLLDWARANNQRVANPHGPRAFKRKLQEEDLKQAHREVQKVWGDDITVMDPMAGGGSIPLESARLGFKTLANEYNPVACTVLEATVDYPFRFGEVLGQKARRWGAELRNRFNQRMERFYPSSGVFPPHCYIYARTVPCPDTGFDTPLVPDWHLLKPKSTSKARFAAIPIVDKIKGAWRAETRQIGRFAGQLHEAPPGTYSDGKGISLFTGHQIPADYIKAMAQSGNMKSALYAVAIKTNQGLQFSPPTSKDLKALGDAEEELACLRSGWEKNNIIPTEKIPEGAKTNEALVKGMMHWADLFSPRQLLAAGVLVEELQKLRPEIIQTEGDELGEAVVHLLSLVIDKFINHNCNSTRWENTRAVIKGKMDRHDYSFKATFAEMAPCNAGSGFEWATDNVLEAYEEITKLVISPTKVPFGLSMGSAISLPQLGDRSITAVVVDPPYSDNVQYAEMADYFYVWLKRTQGHRRPEWFSTYLCDHDQEAVVNISRFRDPDQKAVKGKRNSDTAVARQKAEAHYHGMMLDTFKECHRILRDDGVLTVMFTHKKQEAWVSLFTALIKAGFRITATWPIKTESEHSLHQAQKNAAQSTVILVARKRPPEAGIGYFDRTMQEEIRHHARTRAQRLMEEGLNKVDQLVGSFGPAMEVFSAYDEVRTDTGEPVDVSKAIDEASEAVSAWRVEQLASRGLEGVEAEGKFYLLCWDVLGAAEFRYNEAHLLGKAVGMDVDQLIVAGLVTKQSDKIFMVPVKDRRRDQALKPEEVLETLFGSVSVPQKRKKKDILKIHPNDPQFRTALDGCHALALRYLEAGGGSAGIGSARALMHQQRWGVDSPVAQLLEALVKAAPEALRREKGKTSAAAKFPEFRAWYALMFPLFGLPAPDWTEKKPSQEMLRFITASGEAGEEDNDEDEDSGGEE